MLPKIRDLCIPRDKDAHQEAVFRQPCHSQPLSQRASFATIFDPATTPIVVHLLNLEHPSAVLRRVLAVVVKTFNRMLGGRAWPDVSKKRCEVIAPVVADGNAAATVMTKRRSLRVQAPLFHIDPCLVLGRTRQAVPQCEAGNPIGACAATACAVTGHEVSRARNNNRAARTSTTPMPMRGFSTRTYSTTLNRQSSKQAPSQVGSVRGEPLVNPAFPEAPPNGLGVNFVFGCDQRHPLARFIEHLHLGINALSFSHSHFSIVRSAHMEVS